MKKIFWILLFMTLYAPSDAKTLFLKIGGGSSFRTNSNYNYFDQALNGSLAVGLDFPDGFSEFLSQELIESLQYPNPYFRSEIWSVMANFQYRFDPIGMIKPYLFGGLGLDLYGSNGYSESYFAMQMGLGSEFKLDKNLNLFVEAREHISYLSYSTFSFAPFQAGLKFDLGEIAELPETPTLAPASPPTPPPAENRFIKTGGGLDLHYLEILRTYAPYGGSQSSISRTGAFVTASIEGGVDCPDHFSFFLGGEWLPDDFGVLANIQYTLPDFSWFKPYLFGGLGPNLANNHLTPGATNQFALAFQLGAGLGFEVSKDWDWFIESKLYVSFDLWSANYKWGDMYGPIFLTGVKLNLPSKNTASSPTNGPADSADARGNFFLGTAGLLDLPAQNWQPAYTSGVGETLSAGYEFRDGLVLQLDVENYYFSGTNYSGAIFNNELLILPTLRYLFNREGLRPYVSAGVGIESEFSRSTFGSGAIVNLDVAAGAGIEVPVADRTYVFVEGKYNFIFAAGVTGQDIPFLAGVRFGL